MHHLIYSSNVSSKEERYEAENEKICTFFTNKWDKFFVIQFHTEYRVVKESNLKQQHEFIERTH